MAAPLVPKITKRLSIDFLFLLPRFLKTVSEVVLEMEEEPSIGRAFQKLD